jgi:tetratricopeptide (TPR) repeat protein
MLSHIRNIKFHLLNVSIFLILILLPNKNFGNEKLQAAEKAYDDKKYKEAILHYETLISEGFNSYELYFNLGNAYYRNNEIGKAIYNYERAKKIEPNDEDIKINLAKANAKTIDQIDTKENFFISAVKTNLLATLSTTSWALATITLLSFAACMFFVFRYSSSIAVKRISFISACITLIGFILAYLLGYSALQSKHDNKFGVIVVREVKILNEPTQTAVSKFTLHEGTKIRVVDSNGDWLLIKLDNGNEGWVKMKDVGVI